MTFFYRMIYQVAACLVLLFSLAGHSWAAQCSAVFPTVSNEDTAERLNLGAVDWRNGTAISWNWIWDLWPFAGHDEASLPPGDRVIPGAPPASTPGNSRLYV